MSATDLNMSVALPVHRLAKENLNMDNPKTWETVRNLLRKSAREPSQPASSPRVGPQPPEPRVVRFGTVDVVGDDGRDSVGPSYMATLWPPLPRSRHHQDSEVVRGLRQLERTCEGGTNMDR